MSDEPTPRPWHGTENPFEALHDWVVAEIARVDARITALDGPPPAEPAPEPPVEPPVEPAPEPEPEEPTRGRRGKRDDG